MQGRSFKDRWILMALVCLIIMGCSSPSHASPLGKALEKWMPYGIHGKIMEAGKGTIAVNEKTIFLVDETVKGRKYMTEILSLEGRSQGIGSLVKGKYVLVMGAITIGNTGAPVIIARRIYISDHEIGKDRLRILTKEFSSSPPTGWDDNPPSGK